MTDAKPLAPARKLIADLSRLIALIAEGRRDAPAIARELQKLSDFAAGIAPTKAQEKNAKDTKKEEDEIFVYWRTAAGKSKATFTPQRRQKLRARLREGYSVAAIKRAIDFICTDPFHTGDNESGKSYVDLELICRNATKLEQYIDRGGGNDVGPETGANEETQAAILRAQAQSKECLQRGDTDGYNRAQTEIRRLKQLDGH